MGMLFALFVYVESTPGLQLSSSAGVNPTLPHSRSSLTLRMSPLSSTADTKKEHRSLSSISGLSDTDTLVGSPRLPQRKSDTDETDAKDNDDMDDKYERDDEDEVDDGTTQALLRNYPPVPSPTGAQAGEDVVNLRKKPGGWGFWDLMGWKPMRIMCMTMFLNS